ncbi:MAG: glycosyltransferase family 4 protein, partial [Steroidobacteraceae bacterium]|nr:glycosyltransferase family 4 protein [Steroidobacteraceae bacterium]
MSARPIRVLHLRDSPWVDGPGRTIVDTATHLDPAQIEYHVGAFVAPGGAAHTLVAALRAAGKSVRELEDRGGLDDNLIAQIVRLLDELDIDVLHSSEFRSNIMAQLARRRRRVKLVCTAHGWIVNTTRGRLYRFIDKMLLRRFDAVLFVSGATRSLVPRWWLPDTRTCVLHNGLVLGKYGAETGSLPRRPVDPRNVTLLNVGRLSPEKGQDLLLQAMAPLVARYPGLTLKFAGTGPEEARLRALAQSLGLGDRVHFLGYIHDMPQLYADVDLLVQSSLTEGLPNVIVEAAYLRVPIVATRVGGTDEVVEHGKSGWLIESGDVNAIRAGLEAFLENPQRFVAMGESAQRRIVEGFSIAVRTR